MTKHYEMYKKVMNTYLGEEASYFLAWLDTTNADVSPSTIRNGLACDGGWALHCINVLNNLVKLARMENGEELEDGFKKTLVKVAFLHDIYKINRYEKYLKNQKNEMGQWEQVEAYKTKDEFEQYINNGLTSVIIANRFFKLTDEEIEAIYYAFPSDSSKSNEDYNVGHLADMLRYAVKTALANEKASETKQ